MKNISLLTTKYPVDPTSPWLTNELALAMRDSGHNVTVVALSWMPDDPENGVAMESGIKVVRVRLPSFFYKRMRIVTGLKILLFPLIARFYIKKHVKVCDLLVANTPCVTILGLTRFFRRRYGAKSFLVCWDFFPFYLKDLGLVSNKFSFEVLRVIERTMYKSFDKIGCMTNRNIDFLQQNYDFSSLAKVCKLPIWATIKSAPMISKADIRTKFGLPQDKVLAVFGGAMSIVQDLRNLLILAEHSKELNVTFVLIGSGTERNDLIAQVRERSIDNIIFLDAIPRFEYEKLLQACDIGLIFLSHKLTVPSFPSKSLDYFKLSLPILAGLDAFTDFGGILLNEAKAGYFAQADNTVALKKLLGELVNDGDLRKRLGENGRVFYEAEFDVEDAKEAIISVVN
ncbi:glycosyltransferase family 4 protein [Janthinobacterium sp.]|uniref:glycosyltransferase family 4 protein n=1 Tax=Janthinobacterium sp. TaxID=1871054 RepID=UPI002DB957CA|nr:glycosyltransferase family 4 protein [Janthinobacterium sp.]HEU4819221.1 glycosyltransferase family 4 protein [Janthinobacterium sp.]